MVKVHSLSGEYGHLTKLKRVCLRLPDTEKTCEIEELSEASGTLLVKFAGIDSPEKAKSLGGAELLLDRSEAVPLSNNEFYIEDLKGLRVVLANLVDGREIGEINDIIEGQGDLVEIRLTSGKLCLVPFRNEFFGEINLEKGRVVLLEDWIIDEEIS